MKTIQGCQEPYASRLEKINEEIDQACKVSNRDPSEINLIVVSKNHPADLVRDLNKCGIVNFGENRHQEAEPKAAETSDLDLTWHFVGQLQSKKARAAAKYASVIHSVDRNSVVTALGKAEETLDCFIQINLTEDTARGGINPTDLEPFANSILEKPNLNLLGVMAVAPLNEDANRAFETLHGYSQKLQTVSAQANKISAGMSHDFVEAINFGATHLRIGSAITGNRTY